MKFLHISDTHSCHHRLRDLPEADVIVHSGDFTMNGSQQEAIDFMNWFCDLPYPHKIFICGNHDDCLYGANIEGLDSNVHYLCNSSVEIDGVKFYGVPMFIGDCTKFFLHHASKSRFFIRFGSVTHSISFCSSLQNIHHTSKSTISIPYLEARRKRIE